VVARPTTTEAGHPRKPGRLSRYHGAMRPGLLIAFGCALACRSSAPYTLPAAALNTAIAGSAAALQRASGGCYAECTDGTACNPNTGFCERACVASCSSFEVCAFDDYGVPRCVKPPTSISEEQQQPLLPVPPGLEVSPATGTVPSLPPPRPSDTP
jgi:hypothetical protein